LRYSDKLVGLFFFLWNCQSFFIDFVKKKSFHQKEKQLIKTSVEKNTLFNLRLKSPKQVPSPPQKKRKIIIIKE